MNVDDVSFRNTAKFVWYFIPVCPFFHHWLVCVSLQANSPGPISLCESKFSGPSQLLISLPPEFSFSHLKKTWALLLVARPSNGQEFLHTSLLNLTLFIVNLFNSMESNGLAESQCNLQISFISCNTQGTSYDCKAATFAWHLGTGDSKQLNNQACPVNWIALV